MRTEKGFRVVTAILGEGKIAPAYSTSEKGHPSVIFHGVKEGSIIKIGDPVPDDERTDPFMAISFVDAAAIDRFIGTLEATKEIAFKDD